MRVGKGEAAGSVDRKDARKWTLSRVGYRWRLMVMG